MKIGIPKPCISYLAPRVTDSRSPVELGWDATAKMPTMMAPPIYGYGSWIPNPVSFGRLQDFSVTKPTWWQDTGLDSLSVITGTLGNINTVLLGFFAHLTDRINATYAQIAGQQSSTFQAANLDWLKSQRNWLRVGIQDLDLGLQSWTELQRTSEQLCESLAYSGSGSPRRYDNPTTCVPTPSELREYSACIPSDVCLLRYVESCAIGLLASIVLEEYKEAFRWVSRVIRLANSVLYRTVAKFCGLDWVHRVWFLLHGSHPPKTRNIAATPVFRGSSGIA